MSISNMESKGGNANGHSNFRGREAGYERHGRANRIREECSEEFSARNEVVDDGLSTKLAAGGGTSQWHAMGVGAPHSVSDHTEEQERISHFRDRKDGLNEIQFDGQNSQLANCSLNARTCDRTATDSEILSEEDVGEEETDMYPPPRLLPQFREISQLPNDRSEGRDHCIFDPHFKPECDLYLPIERVDDSRWYGMDICDSSQHERLSTIDQGHMYLPEKLDSASSKGQFLSGNSHMCHCKDLYEEIPRAWKSQVVPESHTGYGSSIYGGVHEYSPSRVSGLSPSSAHSGHYGPRTTGQIMASRPPERMNSAQHGLQSPCSSFPQHLNSQNHQFAHPPPLQEHCATICSARPASVVGNSPHQHHWFAPQHLSPHLPPQMVGRHGGKDQAQLLDTEVRLRRTSNRKPKRRPPFPAQGGAPFVLCQHCGQLLKAPAFSPPSHALIVKLRCGSCLRISKFGIQYSRRPQMAPRSVADGSGSSYASFHISEAVNHVSTGRSGIVEDSSSAGHEISYMLSRYNSGNSSPLQGRNYGNVRRLDDANAATPRKTLTNGLDAYADTPGRESISSSATSTHSDSHNRVKLSYSDSREEAGVTGSGTVKYGTGILSKDKQLSGEDVRKGFGNGNVGSSRNDSQRLDSQVPERNGAEGEECPLSRAGTVPASPRRPGSPLYALLGYKCLEELRQSCPKAASGENASHSCPSNDGHCPARVSDVSNVSIVPLGTPDRVENLPCNHHRILDARGACAECLGLKLEGSVDSAHYDDNLEAGRRSSIVARKNLVEPDQAAAKVLSGFFKRSLKGLADKGGQYSGSSRQKVIVNGHVLSGAAIKKAEDRAGKLRPGCFWYDQKAGFWGVSGGPCVGLLPPFIEEFCYSMARECSNGTTTVLVNGRELCEEDLGKLIQRGLPKEKSKVYSVSFDGTVIDESTGQELKSLGKLAPTVQRKGKGFGMFMPPSRTS